MSAPWVIDTDPAYLSQPLAPTGSPTLNSPQGPFENGGYRYIFYQRISNANSNEYVTAVRTNNGQTFELLDFANAPGPPALPGQGVWNAFLSIASAGTTVYIGIEAFGAGGGNNTLAISSFDMTTQKFGPLITGGPQIRSNSLIAFTRRSDGSFLFLCDSVGGNFQAVVYSGGVWQAAIPIEAATSPLFVGGVLDVNDTFHFAVYKPALFEVNFTLRYNSVSLGGVVAGYTPLAAGSRSVAFKPIIKMSGNRGVYLSGIDKVYLPLMIQKSTFNLTSGSWPNDFSAVAVSNASTAPSPAIEGISDFGAGQQWGAPAMFVTPTESAVYASILSYQGLTEQVLLWKKAPSDVSFPSAPSIFYDYLTNPTRPTTVPLDQFDATQTFAPNFINNGLSLGMTFSFVESPCAVQYYLEQPIAVPPPTPVAGRGIPHIRIPNEWDFCLGRHWRLYDRIDPKLLQCAKKPDCFCTFGEEGFPLDPPPGFIQFNPIKGIPLPLPAAGDTTIFSFTVPVGYDGMILGQFHGFFPTLVNPAFLDGSGDLIWRVSADSRFLADCGAMTVSMGSTRNFSPIFGGIQVRSQNLIKYIVNAPNLSGGLDPQGTIFAGLYGFFYPRK